MALKFANNNSLSAITSTPSGVGGGSLNLINTQTASSSSTISFTSGINSTYKEYIFKFINIHQATDIAFLTFNGSVDTGSNYNVTKTTSFFNAYHDEGDSSTGLTYQTGNDLAQSTDFQKLAEGGSDNDQSISGEMFLFNPSDTTFVKHFISRFNMYSRSDYTQDHYIAGYFNTTSAIDAVQFKMSSGNIDSGTFKMYGVS